MKQNGNILFVFNIEYIYCFTILVLFIHFDRFERGNEIPLISSPSLNIISRQLDKFKAVGWKTIRNRES